MIRKLLEDRRVSTTFFMKQRPLYFKHSFKTVNFVMSIYYINFIIAYYVHKLYLSKRKRNTKGRYY